MKRDLGKWGWLLVALLAVFAVYMYYVRGWDLERVSEETFGRVTFEDYVELPDDVIRAPEGTRWEVRAPMLTSRSEIGAAAIDGKIYVVGGFDAYGRTLRSMEVYDVETDTWSNGPQMPQALHHPAVTTDGEKLYVIGGFVGITFTPTDMAYAFDPGTGRWEEMPLLNGFRGAAAAAYADGTLMVVGGVDPAGPTADAEIYDAEEDRWVQIQPVPTVREHLAAAVTDGKVYVIGGRIRFPDGNVDAAEVYDAVEKKWSRIDPVPTPRSGFGAVAADGRIYVFGGESEEGTIAPAEVFAPEFGKWQPFGELPTPRHGLAAVVVGNEIFVIGGGRRTGFSVSDLNEVLIIE